MRAGQDGTSFDFLWRDSPPERALFEHAQLKKYDALEIALFIIDTSTNEHCELGTAYDLK